MGMAVTHLITGFGLDKRVLECLNLPRDRFSYVDLIPPERNESLPQYALRLPRKIGGSPGGRRGRTFAGRNAGIGDRAPVQCVAGDVAVELHASALHPPVVPQPGK